MVAISTAFSDAFKGKLMLTQRGVSRHPGQVLDTQTPLPKNPHLADTFLLARRPAVQFLHHAFVFRITVGFGQIGLLVEIKQLRILGRGGPRLDAQRFHSLEGSLDALAVRPVREHQFEFPLLGIEVLIRPWPVDTADPVAEIDFILLAGLHTAPAAMGTITNPSVCSAGSPSTDAVVELPGCGSVRSSTGFLSVSCRCGRDIDARHPWLAPFGRTCGASKSTVLRICRAVWR